METEGFADSVGDLQLNELSSKVLNIFEDKLLLGAVRAVWRWKVGCVNGLHALNFRRLFSETNQKSALSILKGDSIATEQLCTLQPDLMNMVTLEKPAHWTPDLHPHLRPFCTELERARFCNGLEVSGRPLKIPMPELKLLDTGSEQNYTMERSELFECGSRKRKRLGSGQIFVGCQWSI